MEYDIIIKLFEDNSYEVLEDVKRKHGEPALDQAVKLLTVDT